MNTFEKLTSPLNTFLIEQGNKIDRESRSKRLFFRDFVLKLVYSVVMKTPSLRLLISELETSSIASSLGFSATAYSTFRDGFSRFAVRYFRDAFLYVLKSYEWMRVEAIDEMGIIKLVDGSLFPTLCWMYWASYKKTKNAIRLHLEFDLNRMVSTEFIAQKANSSEGAFLRSILQKGVTYVADRGYFSFELAHGVDKVKAFFIIRIKSNLKFRVLQSLEITTAQERLPECFEHVSDQIIVFDSDKLEGQYRLVSFDVLQSKFMICTNRFDLTSLQIIMLYAYRWQIELLFKFLKRTLNAIDLFNHSEKGVNIQFYIFMIVIMLKLRLRQVCQQKNQIMLKLKKKNQKTHHYSGNSPELWINSIAEDLYQHWKIGLHWICHLKNLIHRDFDQIVINKLAAH